MSNGEYRPSTGPVRVSALQRLEEMPLAQDILNGPSRETSVMRYIPSDDPLDPPRVIDGDMPFTREDSGALRQVPLPAGEAFAGSPGQWMSQDDMNALVREAELEVQEEMRSADQRKLEIRYTGRGDDRFEITATEGGDGDKLERIFTALSGQALQSQIQPPQYQYPQYARYPQYLGSQDAVEGEHIPPAYPYLPEAIEASRGPLTVNNLMDSTSFERPVGPSFMHRHGKKIAGLVMALCILPAHNIARNVVNGNITNTSEFVQTFFMQDVDYNGDKS